MVLNLWANVSACKAITLRGRSAPHGRYHILRSYKMFLHFQQSFRSVRSDGHFSQLWINKTSCGCYDICTLQLSSQEEKNITFCGAAAGLKKKTHHCILV